VSTDLHFVPSCAVMLTRPSTKSRNFVSITVGAANVDLVEELQAGQLTEAGEAYRRAGTGFARTTLLIVLAALAIGLGSVVWLTRNIVPRVSAYSSFAARVAAGERTTRLRPRGSDELSDLGAVLNEMVDRGENERAYQRTQAELVAALQVTEDEQEAHLLLKRHLERSVKDTSTVVLNRNNSANRLEATTPLSVDNALVERSASARLSV
jgi:methyl-accepting chemotaxis protein